MEKAPASPALDVSAVTLSSLCIVHCLALPVLASVLPLSIVSLENEWVHRLLVMFALPVSGCAIYWSVIGREGWTFPILATTGLGMLVAAAFVERVHEYETMATVAGALLLAVAHFIRWAGRHRHACGNPEGKR